MPRDLHDRAQRRREVERIAAAAARRFEGGRADSIEQAIDAAMAMESSEPGHRRLDRPTANQVRRHLQALAQERLGLEGYRAELAAILRIASEAMELLERRVPDCRTQLVGRAAAGRLDGEVELHIRAATRVPIGTLAEAIVSEGFEEPRFEVVEARCGRLDRLCFDQDGVEVRVTRCHPRQVTLAREDLVTGRPVEVLELAELERVIEALDAGEDGFRVVR
ncbi:MAG: hypothetical protein ACO4CI_10680 [Phycisphaerales bacterium]|jgi:hypothetical protein